MAPLTLVLNRKCGTRVTVIIGVVLGSLSIGLMAVSAHIELMFLFFGVGYGTSCALMKIAPMFLMNQYFPYHHPHHVLATSITLSGYTFGM